MVSYDARKEIETNIRTAVEGCLREFSIKAGEQAESVHIQMISHQAVGQAKPQYVVGGVQVDLHSGEPIHAGLTMIRMAGETGVPLILEGD